MSEEEIKKTAPDADVGTMEDVDAIMKKYDRESNTRIWEGAPKQVVRWLTVAFGIFMIVITCSSRWTSARAVRCSSALC